MAVDDLWRKKGPDGKLIQSERDGRGRRYRVRFLDDTGTPKQRLFAKKADAEAYDATTRADVSRGQYVDAAAGKVSVAEYAEAWRSNQIFRQSTEDLVGRRLRLHIAPTSLGRMPLAQVRRSHVQAWVKDRSNYLAPTTLRVTYSYLVSAFNSAALDRVIAFSPCQDITLPEIDHGELVIPTSQQVHALASALPERFEAIVYPAAACGLRQAETWGLEVDHVNFLRREIRVVQQLVTPDSGAPHLGPVKTKTSRRVVELGVVAAERLARHIELYPPKAVEIEDRTDPRRTVRREARLIFVNARGLPLRRPTWSHPWRAAVTAVEGIPDGFGYHGLRHYYATLLIHAGASVKTVQLALGHSSPTITMNTYIHEWPEAIDRTRNLIDAALGSGAEAAA
jgi:integrase